MKRCAVIGVGAMGRHHARNYDELEDCELVAISDLSEKNLKEVSDNYKCKTYLDYKKMLWHEKIDYISIATSTSSHLKIAMDCMDLGIKNILLEKPISDNLDSANYIKRFSELHDVDIFIGHIERFNPVIKRLKEKLHMIGKIVNISATRVGLYPERINEPVILDSGIHDIDLFNMIYGTKPKAVYGKSGSAISTHNKDDYSSLVFDYGDNKTAMLELNWITPVKKRAMTVTGENGLFELDYINQTLKLFLKKSKHIDRTSYNDYLNESDYEEIEFIIEKDEPLKLEIMSFLKGKGVSVYDGIKALEVVELCQKI